MPWPLTLALWCMDARGNFVQLPNAGGILDQSPLLMTLMGIAWRLWIIDSKDAARHSAEDIDFVRTWGLENDG